MLSTILFFSAFLVFIAANVQHSGLILTIRKHYAEFYEQVGKPPVLFMGPLSMGAAWSFLAYVILGEFKNDEPPEQVYDALMLSRRLFLTSFGILLLAIAVSFF